MKNVYQEALNMMPLESETEDLAVLQWYVDHENTIRHALEMTSAFKKELDKVLPLK